MNTRSGLWLALISICLLFLTGCVTLSDPESSQEYRSHPIAEITSEQDFGQTIISRRPKLNRIQVWLQVPEQASGFDYQVIASLYHKPTDLQPIASIRFLKEDLEKTLPLSIIFPVQVNQPEISYYLRIETTAEKIIVYGRDEDQYSFGEAWIDGEPQVSDAAFRLGYEYNIVDFFKDILSHFKLLLLLLCIMWLLWIPGRVCLLLTGFDKRFDWGERTAISIGLSLAFFSVIFIWTSFANLRWDHLGVWGFLLLTTIIYSLLSIRQSKFKEFRFLRITPNWGISLGLLSVFIASLAVRFVMVRDLSAPAWVDSIHHALLGKLIVMNGMLPESYSPYLATQTANYHAGFHVNLAIFQWLSRIEVDRALLIFGQVLNASMVFSTYLFTTTLVKNQIAGLTAAFVTGLVTPMPAYYTSWGRYTQLAGLVILPAAIALISPTLQESTSPSLSFRAYLKKYKHIANISLVSVLLVGLFLTHYRVFAFELALIFVIYIFSLYAWYKQNNLRPGFIGSLYFFLPTAILSLILILPWLPDTIRTLFIPSLVWSQTASTRPFGDFSWNLLTTARGVYSLVIAGLGFIWAVLQRKNFAWILCTWIGVLLFLANINVWKLPGSNFINNTSVVISLFLPISVLCGFLISWLLSGWYRWLPNTLKHYYAVAIIPSVFLLAWLTSKPLLTIINPTTLLFREIDRPALEWIKENIPSDEVIFINPFAWGYGLYAGSDGGFWISPLSEKPTLPPPVLYGLDIETMQDINLMCSKVIQSNGDPQVLYDLMVSNRVKYIYLGAKGGLLSPTKLQQSDLFQIIFHNQTTWVFKTRLEP
jgi:hypothetical protein